LVEKVLDEEVRPMLTMHGGNVELLEITDNNVAKARLTGACGGCPMAQLTLLGIVENAVKSHIPEVKEVKAG
jgi:Fe-S cluster biogenesis protein NfuA